MGAPLVDAEPRQARSCPAPHPACRGRGQRRVNGRLPQGGGGGHWEAGIWQLFLR